MLRTKRGNTLIDALGIDGFGNGTLTGNLTQNSDGRWKKDIATLEHSLDDLLQLRGISYQWKDQLHAPGTQIGFIAQEVETVFPELVKTDDKGYKSVNYIGVIPVLVEAVKAQQAQINRLKDTEKKNIELENRVKHLETLMERLLNDKDARR